MIQGFSVGILLITLILWFAFGNIRFVAISLITNIMPILLALGLWYFLYGIVDLAVSIVGPVTFRIIVDDTIHFLYSFCKNKKINGNDEKAVQATLEEIGPTLIASTLTLNIGFATLMFSQFLLNDTLGLLSLITISTALFFDLIVLPAILVFSKPKKKRWNINKIFRKMLQGILIVFLILGLGMLVNPSIYQSLPLWILVILGIFGNILQPSYNPFKFGDRQDRGTALQILWTVYITQGLAVVEYAFNRTHFSDPLTFYQYLFLSLSVLGLIFRTWAVLVLGRYFSIYIKLQEDHQIIETGPYRFLRHPSYTGAFLTYFANILFMGSWFSAIVSLPLLFWAFYRRIQFEEPCLRNQFGAEYDNFCKKRWRLVPGIY